MKKAIIAAALVVGLSASVYAQGTIELNNSANGSVSTTAANGGQVFTNSNGHIGLDQDNVSITMLAGTVGEAVTSLTPIVTILGTANFGDNNGPGQFYDYSANGVYTLTAAGVGSTAIAEIELEMWSGTATTYAAATAPGSTALYATVVFDNPTGGGTTQPTTMTGMPAVILASPEPSTIILGGIGAAALLAFRRRKQ
jgi:hypothetical protein